MDAPRIVRRGDDAQQHADRAAGHSGTKYLPYYRNNVGDIESVLSVSISALQDLEK